MPVARVLCVLNGLQWTWIHCRSVFLSTGSCLRWNEKWGVYTVQNSIVSLSTKVFMQQHLVCNSCVSSTTFPECLDRAHSGGESLRWFEGRVAGRMFRRIWPSFLPFFSPFSFLIPQCLAFLPLSLTSSFHPNDYFLHSSLFLPHIFLCY